MSTLYYESNELYHHGVKGQKWGVRRYQNADGSLTNEGKKKYGYSEPLNGYGKYQEYVTKKLGSGNTRANAYASQAIARTIASKRPTNLQKALYTANVVRITKKDNKKKRNPLEINEKDTRATKMVKTDYNNMSDLEFRAKYKTSKDKYAKRAKGKIDPYKKGIAKASVATVINSANPSIGRKKAVGLLAADIAWSESQVAISSAKGKIMTDKILKGE